MKLKPITLIALSVITVSGVWIYSQGKADTRSVEPVLEQVETTPTPQPTPGRALKQNERYIGAMGLYITVPEGMNFRQDVASEIAVNFYIEDGSAEDPTYQLYVVYQPGKTITENGLEIMKKEMEPYSIKEATVGDYTGFEGLVSGPKARYQTLVIKDGKPLSFSTWPPTEENKAITDQVLSTVSFDK